MLIADLRLGNRRKWRLNLASILTESAGARVPDSPAVRLGDAELTYARRSTSAAPALATLLARARACSPATGSG